MEIERKFLIKQLPENLDSYPHSTITQAYISTNPVIRIRQMDDTYFLTVKGPGLLERMEAELVLDAEAFHRLKEKTEGSIIEKTRYKIPWNEFTIELDIFHGVYEGFVMAEIEYPNKDIANTAPVPHWFGLDVTNDARFQNSSLSSNDKKEVSAFQKYIQEL